MKINKFIKTFGLLCMSTGLIANSVFALSASPSATIRDSVKEQVAAELSQIKQGVAKKGFVGNVTSKTDATITLTNLKNQTRTLTVTTDTTVKLANAKDGTLADLKTNDFIIAMGDVDSQNKMTAKRLLVISTPAPEKRVTYFGSLTKIGTSTFSIKTAKGSNLDIKVSAGTKFNDKLKFADLKIDSKVIVISLTGGTTASPTNTALKVYIIQ